MKNTAIFVLGVVCMVAVAGMLAPSITGAASKQSPGYVKHVSCRYWDTDLYGDCIRLEKQLGVACSPPEDAERYQTRYGWFLRPCGDRPKF